MPQGFEEIIAQVERILRVGITVIAAYLVALWIASIWWAFRDIRARTTDVFLQIAATLLVAVFSFAGLVIYLILRPPKTLAQLYEESLEEEAFLQGFRVNSACPVCKLRTEPDFVFCPWCQTRLKRLCLRCEQPMTLRWKMCPYCGLTVTARPPQSVEATTSPPGGELTGAEAGLNGHGSAVAAAAPSTRDDTYPAILDSDLTRDGRLPSHTTDERPVSPPVRDARRDAATRRVHAEPPPTDDTLQL
ncbi:MAG: zinc ribbon domain-containing protein [Chloroflexi bacterium]|nr:zinc ribbon domain-containing protein [Chloroflexota bacterium]